LPSNLVAEAFCNLNNWRLEAEDMESIVIFRALAACEIEEEVKAFLLSHRSSVTETDFSKSAEEASDYPHVCSW
jgi:prophage maintenance system killer protein